LQFFQNICCLYLGVGRGWSSQEEGMASH
jgi:hypothetical protein